MIQQNYRYLFVANSQSWSDTAQKYVNDIDNTGNTISLKVGDLDLENAKVAKIVQNYEKDIPTQQGLKRISSKIILSKKKG